MRIPDTAALPSTSDEDESDRRSAPTHAGFQEDSAGGYKPLSDATLVMELQREINQLKRDLSVARSRIVSLERMVEEDTLLPVLNRRGFVRALDRAIAYVERYKARAAVLYLDLDGFKSVNDRFGHGVGDELLVKVAQTLNANVRRSDMIARLGGDEFAILLWNAGEREVAEKAAHLVHSISAIRLDAPNDGQAVCGASSGHTLLHAGDSSEVALARADERMYAEKRKLGHKRS